jgi:endonuclease-3
MRCHGHLIHRLRRQWGVAMAGRSENVSLPPAGNQPDRREPLMNAPETTRKVPFDIDVALERVAEAVQPYPKAAMFELAERGYATPFQQLVACVISIRTRDEESLPISIRLFETAPTAGDIAALTPQQIDALIQPSTFHERKSHQIHAIALSVVDDFGGDLPCDAEVMRSFAGVGPKCAHLALGIACGEPFISVDVHVDRVVNRWGYVRTTTPEQTMLALEEKLPKRYWVTINSLLVPFGKHICTGIRPKCSTCPVLEMCQQVGVTSHR